MISVPKFLLANRSLADLRDLPDADRERYLARLQRCLGRRRKSRPAITSVRGVISDWLGVAKLAQQYSARMNRTWLFRGQTFPHALLPKIGREDMRKDALSDEAIAYSLRDERWILEQFKRRSRPHLAYEPKSDLDWLAIAQHHGLATRMLDWTESFLVAVYFAIEKAGVNGPATIFAIQRPTRTRNSDAAFALTEPKLYQAPDISPRITAQRGVFTVHP